MDTKIEWIETDEEYIKDSNNKKFELDDSKESAWD